MAGVPPKLASIFNNIDKIPQQKAEGETLKPLKGDLGLFFGKIERYKTAITIEGHQGAGKTQLAFQIADAFAENDYKVAFWAIELGAQSELITRHKEKYIKPGNRDNIFVTDNEYLSNIKLAAPHFDIMIIDSFTKVKYDQSGEYVYSKELDALRNEFPQTIFIVLFQRNSKETIRGGPAPLFDAGINIEVVKVDDTFANNYAKTSKNRYGQSGLMYSIAKKTLVKIPTIQQKTKTKAKKE